MKKRRFSKVETQHGNPRRQRRCLEPRLRFSSRYGSLSRSCPTPLALTSIRYSLFLTL